MSEVFGALTEAEIIALSGKVDDTYNILGDGIGAEVSSQRLFDKIIQNLYDVTTASGISDHGDNEITITISAQQIADGWTTDHIVGYNYDTLDSTSEIGVTDPSAKTTNSITYRLSGIETEDNGHQITVLFRKNKV